MLCSDLISALMQNMTLVESATGLSTRAIHDGPLQPTLYFTTLYYTILYYTHSFFSVLKLADLELFMTSKKVTRLCCKR